MYNVDVVCLQTNLTQQEQAYTYPTSLHLYAVTALPWHAIIHA